MPKLSRGLVNRLVLAAVAAGFLIVIAVVGFAGLVLQRNVAYSNLVTHSYQVQDAIAEYRILTERVETSRRGYLIARDKTFFDGFQANSAALSPLIDRLQKLTADNPRQQAYVAQLRTLQARHLEASRKSIVGATFGASALNTQFSNEPAVVEVRAIRDLTMRMVDEERRLLVMRDSDRRDNTRLLVVAIIVGGLLLTAVAAASVMVLVGYTRDLDQSREALRQLNEGLEDEVEARTTDLRRANDEIQRFAYIVSHDLRSPLVNIMGFTSELEAAAKPLTTLLETAEAEAPQLVTAEARTAVTEDLPEAIRFIRTSTRKMDGLINAILRLSREGRRTLTPERLDMAAMLEGVAATLKHRSDTLGATIEVQGPMPTIISDRLALEQIFGNLLENALKYLSPARPGRVVIRSHQMLGDRWIFDVEDNGRGIDPRDHQRVFDLFRRSGVQDQPGEGIGLAHVRALAYRLGGTVSVESTLDRGSTFRVSLPSKLPLEGVPA